MALQVCTHPTLNYVALYKGPRYLCLASTPQQIFNKVAQGLSARASLWVQLDNMVKADVL